MCVRERERERESSVLRVFDQHATLFPFIGPLPEERERERGGVRGEGVRERERDSV